MKYIIKYPRQELKDFVSHFWISASEDFKGDINNTHHSTACSLANLVFGFKRNNDSICSAFSQLQGQTQMPMEIQVPENGYVKMIGVSIYPYAITQFFNASASELFNRSVPLSVFWNNYEHILADMTEKILDTEQCITILSDYLQSQIVDKCQDKIIVKAAKQIREDNGNINLERLSYALGLSQKQFTRRFKRQMGFNPKQYARILRFESVLYNVTHYSTLSEAAHMNGYYDQAHFIQDFKAFSGHSPNKFFAFSDL